MITGFELEKKLYVILDMETYKHLLNQNLKMRQRLKELEK